MTPERHQRIGQLYHQALALESDRRAAFLRQTCAGDETLREEVEKLLALDKQAGSFMEAPALEVAASLLAEDQARSAVGQRIGHFEVLSLLGAGGMGEVYLALDTRLGRQIALKLLPASFTQDRERVRRFEQEARTASALNHPNILTIYEIGQEEGQHYIATEFIDGQTLRHRIRQGKLDLGEALEVAVQVTTALSSAHTAGIVHRDIKPENIMVRHDGLVKVLDFGLAKLMERRVSAIDSEAPTLAGARTEPGIVMGTAAYMSPEQARGEKVDARSDLFSLGVMLYEIVAGRAPFGGSSASDVIAAILREEPRPLRDCVSRVPAELERIVRKALRKDRGERYQTAEDLLADLKRLKPEIEFAARPGPQVQPTPRGGAAAVGHEGRAGIQKSSETAALTTEGASARATSGAKIILGVFTSHRLGLTITIATLAVAVIAAFFYFNQRPALTEKDAILLADFSNSTGEAVFDGTLKQALAMHLEQSPFLNIFSDERVLETLRFMGRSPDQPITRAVAREICERQGIKAMLTGSIASLGRNYVIALEAVNARSGDTLAREQVEAEGKEQVLRTLGAAASNLRRKLGESLPSLERFDAPLEQATTSSLEAFRAFSVGREQGTRGKNNEAIPFIKRAIELDPNFADAHAQLALLYSNNRQRKLAAEFAEKAFKLKDRVSEREKFDILLRYYNIVTKEVDKCMEVASLWKQTYPRDAGPRNNLSFHYNAIGQFEKAVLEAREAIPLRPSFAPLYSNLARALVRLNRFDEATAVFEQAVAQKTDTLVVRLWLYEAAFVRGDITAMQQYINWARGNPDEYRMLYWQAKAAAFQGQWRQAENLSRRAVEMGQRGNRQEEAVEFLAQTATRGAAFGDCQPVGDFTQRALAITDNSEAMIREALALALCGKVSHAQSLAQELIKRNPQATLLNSIWLPVIQAAIELKRGNHSQAILQLEPVRSFEGGAEFWPNHLRGQAYLRLKQGAEAGAEFQKILDHRGWDPTSHLYPLAHLGLAQAAALSGDLPNSHKHYQDFLALWKDADTDLPILIEAKKEYEKLK